MKKILSVVLAFVLVMSLMCVVPVSAVEYAACPVPYAFVDFENGLSPFASNGAKYVSTVVDSGIPERGKVAQITVTGNVNDGSTMKNGPANITTPISIGDKITVSMWIKSNVKLTKGQFSIIITGMADKVTEGKMTASSYNCWTFPFDPTSTEWQYVSTTVTSTFSSDETTAFAYRMGNTGGLNLKEGETDKGTTTFTDRIYQIDDFEMKIEKVNQMEKKEFPYAENIALADNESWAGVTASSVHASDVVSVENGTEADPAPAGDKYLRIDHNGAKCMGIDIALKENLRSNHIYMLSFKTRGTDLSNSSIATSLTEVTETNGTKVKKYLDMGYRQMVYQVMYEVDDIKNGATGVNSPNASATSNTIAGATKIYRNFYFYNNKLVNVDSEHPGYDPNGYADWFTVTVPIVSDSLNVEEFLSSSANLRLNFWLYNQSGQGLGNFDFDDIQVLDLGPVSNGGFDYTPGSSYILNGGGGSTNFRGIGWKFDSGIKNWGVTNGSSAYTFLQGSSRIPDEQQDDKWAILYGQYTSDAEMYKYVPMSAGSIYTIKGYVRGQKGNNNEITKGRARLVVDYTGETLENEIYDVSKLGTNGVIYGDWVEFEGGYNLEKPLTVSVDLTELDLIEGKEETSGIMPRTPKVIVDFDEDWEENVNAPGTIYHTVYMDGFKMTREANNGYPFATEATATMSAIGVVTPRYTFTTSGNKAVQDVSVYKLIANNKYCGTFYSKSGIVVPEAFRSASDLAIEIVPITSEGYIGEPIRASVTALPAVEGITLTQEDGEVTVATDKALTGVKLIFATYDAHDKLVDWYDIDVTLGAGETDTYASVDLEPGVLTKAMLWEDIVTCVPIAKHVEW